MTTPLQNFDPDSPLLVVQGTLTLAVLGSATGATLAAFKAQNPFALGMNMGLNGSIAGLTFFAIREYLVSPLLLATLSQAVPSYNTRSLALHQLHHDQTQNQATSSSTSPPNIRAIPSHHTHNAIDSSSELETSPDLNLGVHDEKTAISRVRNDRVLDSALAGALTGGGISWTFRGRRTFPRAALTSGLITALGQYMVNNVRVARLEVLARRSEKKREAEQEAVGAGAGNIDNGGVIPVSSSTTPSTSTTLTPTQDFPTLSNRLVDFFRSLSPVRKISDDEYLQILYKQREGMREDLQAWEVRMRGKYALEGRGGNYSTSNSDSKSAASTGQTIDIGQLMRQLDGVERRISALESKIANEGPEAAAKV
ncbi:hypothetical protein HD553DRAFT_27413 [Filobasidium floriforme]|uniref:uncharacterized protein n=1 Tax=Filobasidium floriforme TaxID=5210 RepID=UPI001E8E8D57|nr:uncharacterized protein HD553DRAFT_27413 [Filobasidium floriforme]KAH8085374.1 hypothetical protein HD553DRAFT_27413 [Filobasidium floriforme]